MFTAICPKCRERINGPNEEATMRDYSWHWLIEHLDPPELEES